MAAASEPFERLPAPPTAIDAPGVLTRLVDGLGFRYRWATEGLVDDDADWRATDGSMSLGEVVEHVLKLVAWTRACLGGAPRDGEPAAGLAAQRRATLAELVALRAHVAAMTPDDLAAVRIARKDDAPFWFLVNGPLADALTHVGQIAAWRRQAGSPAPRANVFAGVPPETSA